MTPIGVGREDFGFILKCGGTAVGFILHRTEHTETAKFFSPAVHSSPEHRQKKQEEQVFPPPLGDFPFGKACRACTGMQTYVYKA